VMFDPSIEYDSSSTLLRVTIQAQGRRLIIPVTHDGDGREVLDSPITIDRSGVTLLPRGTHGVLVTGTKSGCTQPIWVPVEFSMVVERIRTAK
jgi:hypothetical protein